MNTDNASLEAKLGGCLVAIGVFWPVPGAIDNFSFRFFHALVEMALRKSEGREPEVGGIWGPGFMLALAPVQDRNAAVHQLHQISERTALTNFSVVAFYDSAEAIWRPVFPSDLSLESLQQFLDIMTPENINAASQYTQSEIEADVATAVAALAKFK